MDHVPGTVDAHLGAYVVEPRWHRVRDRGVEGAIFLATARRLGSNAGIRPADASRISALPRTLFSEVND